MHNIIEDILHRTGHGKYAVIPILQAVQNEYGYLPEDVLKTICELSEITPAEIHGVASFYSQFRFEPAGKHTIKVCVGTACHVKGADKVYEAFHRDLKIPSGKDTDDQKQFTLKKVGCLGCCSLAPAVQIDEITYGHVNPVNTKGIIGDFIKRKESTSDKYTNIFSDDNLQGEIRVGLGSCCIASGSEDVRQAVEAAVYKNKLNVKVKEVGCVGMCHQVPLLEVVSADNTSNLYAKVKPEDVSLLLRKNFKPKSFLKRLSVGIQDFVENVQYENNRNNIESYSINVREKHVAAFLGNQIPIATEFRGILNPVDIVEYLTGGGFAGLDKAFSMQPEEIIGEITKSGIKGRGGAGFPTGQKWQVVAENNSDLKYIICNGDEGDPGAFMDRMLLESYPYRIIEGMIIAAYACRISMGYMYIRAEYPLAVYRVKQAIDKCYEFGFLGNNIRNSGFSFDLKIKEGAGAFVCGEETALIASIEGKRGFPRYRPPYPAEKGLWNKPTLINNTETFAQVPHIIKNGHKDFSSVGTKSSKGTKVFALAGKISRGGLIEVPMGISIRTIIEEIGGGVQNNKKLKAVQIGGPSGACVPEHLTDRPIDFDSLQDIGAMMGSGGLVVLDENDCMVDIARYFLSFTQNESCGKCTFCRIGTRKMLDILEKLCAGKAIEQELEELENLAIQTKKGSLCGLGQTAPNPVLSGMKHFKDEYIAHIAGKCPAGKCKDLINYFINDDCIGCTICAQQCPADAITFNPYKKHEIEKNLCVKCGNCKLVCPQNAVEID